MSSQQVDRIHPVVDFASRLSARLDEIVAVPAWSMSPEEHRQALCVIAQDEAKLAALKLRVLVEADRSGSTNQHGAGTAADWLAGETRQVRREARSDLQLGKRLEQYAAVSAAMDAGSVNLAQARAITTALDRLPPSGEFAVDPQQRVEAERHLVGLAGDHDAKRLRLLGARIFELLAPELAEKFEARKLEQEEARARRRTSFTMWEDDEGACHGRFTISDLHGEMLRKMILAIASYRRPTARPDTACAVGIDPDLPPPLRHGLAFSQLIESTCASDLPKTGGCGATVVVTMTLNQLLAKLEDAGVCTLDTGGRISAAEARRLACAAGIIPIVLGGKSQVLDVGRKRRLHPEAMRVGMGVRDGGCTAEGCETPPGMCHAHHDTPWSEGGSTNVATGRLLCPQHHRRIHDPRYEITCLSGGKVSFHRRT
jgi:hypothetical protein